MLGVADCVLHYVLFRTTPERHRYALRLILCTVLVLPECFPGFSLYCDYDTSLEETLGYLLRLARVLGGGADSKASSDSISSSLYSYVSQFSYKKTHLHLQALVLPFCSATLRAALADYAESALERSSTSTVL